MGASWSYLLARVVGAATPQELPRGATAAPLLGLVPFAEAAPANFLSPQAVRPISAAATSANADRVRLKRHPPA